MEKEDIYKNYYLYIFYLLFAFGLFLSFWYAHHQELRGDQFQMLQKGYIGAYIGYWISFGNSASAVGNVPGTLSSLVVGLPLLIVDSPWAPMTFLILLHAASFFLLDSVIKNTFHNNNIRLTFLVLYWLNPWFLFENKLYNVSYLSFCSALHIWSAFKLRQEKSFWYTFLHLIAIGMAMQLHHSWVLLAIISIYLFYKKLIQVNRLGVFLACLIVLASLVPYFQEFITNESIRQNDGIKSTERYIGWGGLHVYPVLKALCYWLRYGSFFFTKYIVSNADFDWMFQSANIQKYMSYLYQAVIFSIGAFTLWISFISNKFAYKKVKNLIMKRIQDKITDEEWVILYANGALIAVLVSAVLSPISFVHWHLMIIFPFALFPLLVLINRGYSRYFAKFFVPVLVYLLAVNLITSIDSGRFELKQNYKQQTIDFVNTNKVLKNHENIEEFIKQDSIFDSW